MRLININICILYICNSSPAIILTLNYWRWQQSISNMWNVLLLDLVISALKYSKNHQGDHDYNQQELIMPIRLAISSNDMTRDLLYISIHTQCAVCLSILSMALLLLLLLDWCSVAYKVASSLQCWGCRGVASGGTRIIVNPRRFRFYFTQNSARFNVVLILKGLEAKHVFF